MKSPLNLRLLGLALICAGAHASPPAPASAPIDNFALMDQTGRLRELYRLSKTRAVVLISYGIGCPIVRRNISALNSLQERFRKSDVRFFLIDANPQDDRAKLAVEAEAYKIQLPILIDDTQEVTRSLNVNRTGDAVVLDPRNWTVVFKGALNDRLGYDVDNLEAKENYLETALTELLSGKPIQQPQTQTLGCAISLLPRAKVTYHADISPLIQAKCARCHQPGGVSPTNLWTYPDLKGWSKMLKEVVRTEKMPPWTADPTVTHLKTDPSLSARQKKTLYDWIDSGLPEGKKLGKTGAKSISPSLQAPRQAVREDLKFPMKEEITIDANTSRPWHYEKLAGPMDRDLWISAFQGVSSNRSVVQHLAFIATLAPVDLSDKTFEPQFSRTSQIYNYMYATAGKPRVMEPGLAFKIPKGSYLYLEAHFRPTGKEEKWRVKGIFQEYSGPQPPREFKYSDIGTSDFTIPPNTESHTVRATKTIDSDQYLVRVGTHMHWHGQRARLSVILPDGKKKLIYSARYLFKYRGSSLLEPILLKAGSILEAEFEYDNSPSNPARIRYDQPVVWGPDAFRHEMALMHLYSYPAK